MAHNSAAPDGRAHGPAPITPQDAAALRLPWTSLLSREDLERHVARYPDMSWRVPDTNSYLVAGPWRNRRDIVEVFESRGERARPDLWAALLRRAPEPYSAVLVDPTEYRSAAGFYRRAGVGPLEEVIVLRTSSLPGQSVPVTLELATVRGKGLESLLRVDHGAFPWFWRNSREEFEQYLDTPGVRVCIGVEGEEPVGYVGVTELGGWAHVDRLAVHRDAQGRGYGAQMLSWALRWASETGARYVQLSTQGTNARSQRLYQRFGFKPTRGGYRLFGAYLRPRGE